MSAQIDEDTIDLQGLQAQIDLSMSFAQNLVTSWVKPVHFAQTSRKRDLEIELKEYMRRPARLGVGAPIPETQSLAREAAILKSKLGGKKRRREEAEAEIGNIPSEDEEESRAGAIKQKTRLDPFGAPPKKKKKEVQTDRKKLQVVHPVALATGLQTRAMAEDGSEVEEVERELLSKPDSPASLRKQKGKKRFNDADKQRDKPACTQTPFPPVKAHPLVNKAESSHQTPTSSNILKSIKLTDSPLLSPVRSSTATHLKVIDVSLTSTPSRSPGHHQTVNSGFLKQPLLNLDGSPGVDEGDGEREPSTPKSSKKKRKRRKRKAQAVPPEP